MSRKPGKTKAVTKAPAKKAAPKRKAAAKKRSAKPTPTEPKAAKVRGYSKDGLTYAKGLRD